LPASSSGIESLAILLQFVEVLGLVFWGTFMFWLASVGDSLRQIETNTR
jgi:hypothetical protein